MMSLLLPVLPRLLHPQQEFAPGGEDELKYGDVPLAPLIFQDDILHGVCDEKEARNANLKIDRVIKQLNLRLNEDKTFCTVIGSKRQRQDVKLELQKGPLMCGGFEIQLKDKFKWLGQIMSAGGLTESVADTVQAREGKIRGACLEISQIVNDWRARVVGGMETALLLWEVCCVPSLLHGSGTWTGISKNTEKQLNKILNWFLRLVLQVGPGASLAALSWDFSMLEMSLRVQMEKVMFVLYLRNLENTTLS